MPDSRARIAIIGAGKLGSALAEALANAGFRVAEIVSREHSRNWNRAGRLARQLKAQRSSLVHPRLDADVIWLCVPDDLIAPTAKSLAKVNKSWEGKIALHSSGALGSRELAAFKARGAAIASAHPMMTFALGAPANWRDIPFAIEGDQRAVKFAQDVARRLHMASFIIDPKNKPLYHALGSFASPILVSLLSSAERVAQAAGVKKEPREIIGPILLQTIHHYLNSGLQSAFAGPMLRGDLATIRRHLENLRRVPGALDVYRVLAVEAAEHLPVARRTELKKLLARSKTSARRKQMS